MVGGAPAAGAGFVFEPVLPEDPIAGYLLPKKATSVPGPPGKKRKVPGLSVSGTLDTGPNPVDYSSPTTVSIGGGYDFPNGLTTDDGGKTFVGEGTFDDISLFFEVKPPKKGGAKAKFTLEADGDFSFSEKTGSVFLRFENDDVDATGQITLTDDEFKLRKIPGTVVLPAVNVTKLKAKLKGDGKDTLTLVLGFDSDGDLPATPSSLSVGLGGYGATIAGDQFTRKGSKDTFTGRSPGVTKAVVDYAKEKITVKVKNVDLGNYVEGPVPVTITVGIAGTIHTLLTRTVRTGKSLKY